MIIFEELTQAQKEKALEEKAVRDSVFLVDDVMVSLENEGNEYEVSAIKDTDSFKTLIFNNVRWVWNNELPDDAKRYYYQQLHIFISTQEEQNQYFDRLIALATDDVMKRFTVYTEKHKDVTKVVVKKRMI